MEKAQSLWCKYYDYLLIMLIYGILHLFMHTDYWDDLNQLTVLKSWDYHLFSYLCSFYESWGSTVILIGTEAVMGALPNIIWKVLDVIMIALIYHFITRIVHLLSGVSTPDACVRIWSMLLFLNFPYSIFATAGWLTTTIAYAWPFAMFFYALYTLLSSSGKAAVKPATYLLFFVAVTFAANYYLHSVILLVLFLAIYAACKTKSHGFRILFAEGMIGVLLNLALLILSPGNRVRNIEDARFHDTAELLHMSFGGHIRMGVNTAFYHFVSVPNIILFTFCVTLAVCTFHKCSRFCVPELISLIPLSLDIFWTGYVFFQYTVPNRTLSYVYPDALFKTCPKAEQYCVMVSALLMVAAMCYLLAFLTDFSTLSWILVGTLLVVGLFPETILGFTTTVSASIMRVAAYFYFSAMFCTYILVNRFALLKSRLSQVSFYTFAVLGALLNILQIIRHIMVYG